MYVGKGDYEVQLLALSSYFLFDKSIDCSLLGRLFYDVIQEHYAMFSSFIILVFFCPSLSLVVMDG